MIAAETRDAINLRPGDQRASLAAGIRQTLKYSTGRSINYAGDELLIGCFRMKPMEWDMREQADMQICLFCTHCAAQKFCYCRLFDQMLYSSLCIHKYTRQYNTWQHTIKPTSYLLAQSLNFYCPWREKLFFKFTTDYPHSVRKLSLHALAGDSWAILSTSGGHWLRSIQPWWSVL